MVPVQQNITSACASAAGNGACATDDGACAAEYNACAAEWCLTMGSHEIITLEPCSDPWAEGMASGRNTALGLQRTDSEVS